MTAKSEFIINKRYKKKYFRISDENTKEFLLKKADIWYQNIENYGTCSTWQYQVQ